VKTTGKLGVKILLKRSFSMILIVLFLTSTLTSVYHAVAEPGSWWDLGWAYRKSVTIDHTKVAGSLSSFPVLVSITDSDLASKAQVDGDDIVFTDEYAGKLNHEIEYYNSSSGRLVAWVNMPSLSSVNDTKMYMYYGNSTAANQQNVHNTWDSNYVLVEHLHETSGTVIDSSSGGNNGTAMNGVSRDVPGKINGADQLDGVNDYVEVADASNLEGMSALTLEVWLKQSTYHNNGIMNKGGAGGVSYLLQGWSDSALYFAVDGQTNRAVAPVGSYPLNEWYHLTGVCTGTQLLIYVNSVEKASSSKTASVPSDAYPLQVGQNGVGTYFSGSVDEVRISKIARSSAWIATEYNNQNNPATFYSVGVEETPPTDIVISNETPQDGAVNILLNPTLRAHLANYQGLMNITFSTNASGTWQTITTYQNAGTGYCTANATNMNQYETKYWWRVSAVDEEHGKSTTETYSFTTKPLNVAPTVSDPSPANQSTGVSTGTYHLDFYLSDVDTDLMNYTVATSPGVGTGSGTNVANGGYSVDVSGLRYSTTYTWIVNATDGKDSTLTVYTFTTQPIQTGAEKIGEYACMGLGYMGSAVDKNVAYAVWQGPIDVSSGLAVWFAEFDKTQGWIVKNQTVFDPPWGERHPFYGYWGNQYHVGWFDGSVSRIALTDNATFEGFQQVNGAGAQYYLPGSLPGNTVPSSYSFDNNYAWVIGSDTSLGDEAIAYWTWNASTGWSDKIIISSTLNSSHATNFPALLPVSETAWYMYYTAYGSSGPQLFYVATTDQGATWGIEHQSNIALDVSSNSRPSFARYGNNFYIFLIDSAGDVVVYNSTDGVTWGNKQTLYAPSSYMVAQGYAVDQKTLVWTASDGSQYKRSSLGHYGVGDQYGGVKIIPEMQANPTKPSVSYPSSGTIFPSGTSATELRVVVHGSQTYDVAFYWANGTFIGEDKLLSEGELARVTVEGLSDGSTNQWYAVARGATYGFWGGQLSTTSDQSVSDTWSFTVQAKEEPYVIDEYPTDGSAGVNFNPTIAMTATDYQSDLMNITFSTNASGTWGTISTYTNVRNGRYSASTTNMNSTVTKYYWRVAVTDGSHWSNFTYSFTTRHASGIWWDQEWLYRKLVVIDHTKVVGNLTDFPVLINIVDSSLAAHAQSDGDDIAFTDFSGNKLAHEIELYKPATGELVTWVKVPSLSTFNDTMLYLYYGNDACGDQQNVHEVWDSNYVAVLHLHETSGAQYDSTEYANDGNPEGGVVQGAVGKINGGDYFSSGSQVTLYDDNYDLGGMGELTIEAWVKQPSYHSNGIIEKNGLDGYLLQGWSDQQMYFAVGGGESRAIATAGSYPLNQWYHLVGIFNGTHIFIYIDASLKNYTAKAASVPSSNAPVHVGSNGAGNYFNGFLDEVRISNTTRALNWITTEYNNQLAPSLFYIIENEEQGIPPERPVISGEVPVNGSQGVNVNPTLSVVTLDYQSDLMSITFSTNATGTWQPIGSYVNVGNARYNVTPTTMNGYSTEYWWRVFAVDSKSNSTERTYRFTTRPENYLPTVSDPSPANGNAGVSIGLSMLSFRLADLDGETLDYTVTTSPDVGNSTGTHVANGIYYVSVSKLQFSTEYAWTVNVTDGKSLIVANFTFVTEAGPPTTIGAYYCAGLGYVGGPDADGNFYAVWQQLTNCHIRNYTEPAGSCTLYWGRYNTTAGRWDVVDRIVTNNYEAWGTHPAWGFWDDKYHIIWDVWGVRQEETMGSSSWEGFGSMSYGRDHEDIDGNNGEDAVSTSYSFDNEHAWMFITQVVGGKWAVTYVPWSKDSGWGAKVRVNSTEHTFRVDCGSLLTVNRNKWIIYYTAYPSGYNHLRYVISTDQGRTWGPEHISSISSELGVNIRPTFARYGDTFYIFLVSNGGDIVVYKSNDGENWGNRQIVYSPSSWQWPTGVLMDQNHLIWTGSDLNQWYTWGAGTGDQVGGIFPIPEIIASPGKPVNVYPENGHSFPVGTTSVQLQVGVSGDQTYDVAFYWANGTYIGMDRLLRAGDIANMTVHVADNKICDWYAVARGATHSYWGPPKTTTDEQRSSTFRFAVGIGEEPQVAAMLPVDGATAVAFNPALSAEVYDFQSDLMNITFSTNATGVWSDLVNLANVGNGIYNVTTTGMDRYGWKYFWKVTAIDSIEGTSNATIKIFSFTTIQKSILSPFDEGWRYVKAVTIDHTKISGGLFNFTVLVDITDPDLASKAQDNGFDILFMNTTGVSRKLAHEVEYFNGTTGHLIAWMKVPYVSSTTDTVLYMYYGNPSCGDQQNIAETWDQTFKMVQHFEEDSSPILDSTAYDKDGAAYNGASLGAQGVMDRAVAFDGSDDYAKFESTDLTAQITVEGWVRAKRQTNWQTVYARGSPQSESWYSAWDTEPGNAYKIQWWVTDANNVRHDMYGTTALTTEYVWYYIVLTFDGSRQTGYVNGLEEVHVNWVGTIKSSSEEIYLARNLIWGEQLNGLIDEFRISNVSRSNAWILATYNNQRYPSTFISLGLEQEGEAPSVSYPDPADGTVNVPRSQSTLTFDLYDNQGDPMNYTVTTSPNIGSGSGTNVVGGRYTVTISGLSYSTTYSWTVSTTDGKQWTNKTFYFTTAAAFDLIATSINVLNNGCSIYCNATDAYGYAYYYPVEVIIQNTGIDTTESFFVKLEVYWTNGSLLETSGEILISSLGSGATMTVNFTSVFHPAHTGTYRLNVTVDSHNNVAESNETNNTLEKLNITATVIGDINGDRVVNLFDAIAVSVAWGSTPADPHWNAKADLNHDGVINILDATKLSLHWGQTA
jgi:ketosteroid isomerase-like protein